ncbi:MAG: amidohydrolase family protein, partial [Myxococcota bacterium]
GNSGECYYTVDEVDRMVDDAHEAGAQVTAHALGPRGIEVLLSAYERVFARRGADGNSRRHRIDHFEFPTDDQVKRAVGHRLLFAVQPGFSWFDDNYQKAYRTFLTDSVFAMQVPLKRIADMGGILLGGSDSPVQHFNPFLHIQGMLSFPLKDQRLGVYEALRTFTWNAAYATFEEDDRGTLRAGKCADFVVLDNDPFTVDREKVQAIKVVSTYIDGRRFTPITNPYSLLVKGLLGLKNKV